MRIFAFFILVEHCTSAAVIVFAVIDVIFVLLFPRLFCEGWRYCDDGSLLPRLLPEDPEDFFFNFRVWDGLQ